MADIERLCAVEPEGIEAAILGRSLYEGAIDFKIAQSRADELGDG
jgi:phosphoribosylformimino-5-aminoimidazole carboxamide ribotide isomerase